MTTSKRTANHWELGDQTNQGEQPQSEKQQRSKEQASPAQITMQPKLQPCHNYPESQRPLIPLSFSNSSGDDSNEIYICGNQSQKGTRYEMCMIYTICTHLNGYVIYYASSMIGILPMNQGQVVHWICMRYVTLSVLCIVSVVNVLRIKFAVVSTQKSNDGDLTNWTFLLALR